MKQIGTGDIHDVLKNQPNNKSLSGLHSKDTWTCGRCAREVPVGVRQCPSCADEFNKKAGSAGA